VTKKELEIAQFLHHVATRAEILANAVDPKMEHESILGNQLDALRTKARYTFSSLVGRQVDEVDSVELNTESPAKWTKAKPDAIWRRR